MGLQQNTTKGNSMKLHKVLQQVSLETLGSFTNNIRKAGYDLCDLDDILNNRYFSDMVNICHFEAQEERVDELGRFILRACRVDHQLSVFTLKDVISILDKDYQDTEEPTETPKYKINLDFSEALEQLKDFKKEVSNNGVPVLKVPFDLLYTALFEPNSEENKILRQISDGTAKTLDGERSFLILPSDKGYGLDFV